jgi:hypothetical protein
MLNELLDIFLGFRAVILSDFCIKAFLCGHVLLSAIEILSFVKSSLVDVFRVPRPV